MKSSKFKVLKWVYVNGMAFGSLLIIYWCFILNWVPRGGLYRTFIPALSIIFILGSPIFFYSLTLKYYRWRANIIKNMAPSIGLSYYGKIKGISRFNSLLPNSIHNVLKTKIRDADVIFYEDFDCYNPPIISYVGFSSEVLTLPEFRLFPRSFFRKILGRIFKEDIALETNTDFSLHYTLHSDKSTDIRRIFSHEVIKFFTVNRGWHVEGSGKWLIFSRRQSIEPEEIKNFFRDATNVFQVFRRNLV
jgi:hypothetical protein